MSVPPLLAELLVAAGVSGSEDAVQAIVRREADAMGAEITVDVLGSTVARVRGSAAGGVATQIVCIPLRYMHTAGEIAQLTDVDATSRLLEASARSLTTESSFVR